MKYEIRNTKYEKQKGFTILESIVAILILSLSIAGVFSAVRQGLSQTTMAKEEVKAFYLAQEAVEIVRNKRDANRLAIIASGGTGNWLTGIAALGTDPCYFGKTCRADAKNFNLVDCGGGWGSCPKINQDLNTFVYSYDSNPETNFKREIQIEQISDDEIAVTVRVSWSKGIINSEFKAKTYLFNWI